VFGVSFGELTLVAVVTLIVVGPKKLPVMLRTLGEWTAKARRMITEVRSQTGIDDILRQEGIKGGLGELRGLIRGELAWLKEQRQTAPQRQEDPYNEASQIDAAREYPPEGPDAAGALPEDLLEEAPSTASAESPQAGSVPASEAPELEKPAAELVGQVAAPTVGSTGPETP
jgi:sec-independent protein translocase protein TatB